MSADEYRTCLRELGLTPARPSHDGTTIHVDRDRHYHAIPDPEALNDRERADFIALLKFRMGITDH